MAIGIHFKGRLRDPRDLAKLVAELADVAESLGWAHEIVEGEFSGLSLTPHRKAGAFALVFDRHGVLRDREDPRRRSGSVQTQEAPIQVHVGLVKLLKHLEKRYFAKLEVADDGGYWETGDLAELERRRDSASGSLGALVRRLRKDHHRHSEESVDALAKRIERALSHSDTSEGGDEERERIRGPVPPDDDQLREWTVAQWADHFEKHDEHKNTAMRLMRTRPATETEIARALKQADEEDELRHQAMLVALDRIDKRLRREADETGPAEDDEPAWKSSAPAEFDDADEEESDLHPEAIRRKCPPLRATVDLAKALARRMRSGRVRAAALEYAESILATAIVGVQMGYYWAHTEGFPKALAGRFLLAAKQLDVVAGLLRGCAPLPLGEHADRAERIARDFRAMERRA